VVLDVEATYVNCWRNYTRFRTLYQILDDLGATIDIHRQSTPHDELVDRLQQHDGPRTVVILDEEPMSADEGTIRGDLGDDSYEAADQESRALQNLMHVSEPDDAEDELRLWFPEQV